MRSQAQTVSRRLSPPIHDANICSSVANGPYTLGVPSHGGRTAEMTGSEPGQAAGGVR